MSNPFICIDPAYPDHSSEHRITADLIDREREFFDSSQKSPVVFARIACPTCNKAFASSRVVTGHPAMNPKLHRYTTARRLYCDHCRQLVSWWEFCDAEGQLCNELVNGDGHIRFVLDSETIAVFLKHNPQAVCEEAA